MFHLNESIFFLKIPQSLKIPGQILILPHLELSDRFLSFDPGQSWQLDHSHWSKGASPPLDSTDHHLGPSYEI